MKPSGAPQSIGDYQADQWPWKSSCLSCRSVALFFFFCGRYNGRRRTFGRGRYHEHLDVEVDISLIAVHGHEAVALLLYRESWIEKSVPTPRSTQQSISWMECNLHGERACMLVPQCWRAGQTVCIFGEPNHERKARTACSQTASCVSLHCYIR